MNRILKLIRTIIQLPLTTIFLDSTQNEGLRMYASFTSGHPRIPFIKKKTIGVALIDLQLLGNWSNYIKTVSGKNSAAYLNRKCIRAGYIIELFNPNHLQDQILEIHRSQDIRQGKSIDPTYLKPMTYPINQFNRYLGIFLNGKLCGYIWAIRSGELLVINRIMGHKAHLEHGIMYSLVLRLVEAAYQESNIHFVMYDTLLMATPGLSLFKKRTGFTPYRVFWKLQ